MRRRAALVAHAQRDQRRLTGAQLDLASDRALAGGRLVRAPVLDGERAGPRSCDRDPEPPLDTSLRFGVPEAWFDAPAQGNVARKPLDSTGQLAKRREPGAGERHHINQAHHSTAGMERRLKHVRARPVLPLDAVRLARSQLEAAAPLGVKQRREQARRIEVRHAQPVDCSVTSDQRHGPAIADRSVIADRRIPARPHAPFRLNPSGHTEWIRTRTVRPGRAM